MNALHPIDIGIIIAYVVGVILAGVYFSKKAAEGVDSYFLGGRSLPWYLLGISNASGMFDITGTMWTVGILFMFGLKSVFLPWVWPTFNQIFLMIFLAAWVRRSHVMTGAEWLATRFSKGPGLEASHIATVFYALVLVVGMIAYAFIGIGKFAHVFLPWDLSPSMYALLILGATTLYVTAGGMYGVVLTDLVQFVLMSIVSVWVGLIAIRSVTAQQINDAVPDGWSSLTFGWKLNLDWSELIPQVQNELMSADQELYQAFAAFFMMALIGGILKSFAGPFPGYDMQRILACRNSREAAYMSGMITPILMLPRYFMIAGITVLALVNFSDDLLTKPGIEAAASVQPESNTESDDPMNDAGRAEETSDTSAATVDFEQVLPFVIQKFIPVGLTGLVLAGLLAAFMSTFDSTVNSGAAYLVNDVYKRYVDPQSSSTTEVRMSYVCSIGVVILGIALGFHSQMNADSGGTSIERILQWVTVGLGSGYIAPNVLKWYWWRLNGIGYFAGMMTGTILAIMQSLFAASPFVPDQPLYAFPFILAASLLMTAVASLLTQPEQTETLVAFYRSVRPWGFWGPIREQVLRDDPSFRPNQAFARDMFNCFIGTVWQTAIIVLPIYVVIRHNLGIGLSLAIAIVTTVILKRNWFDKLEPATAD